MPNGRAVLLLRRLSAGDSKLLSLNINHNCKDTQLGSPVNLREFSFPKRLSTNCPTCHLSVHPLLSRSLSDNIIKMASTSTDVGGIEKAKFTNRLINEKSPYLLQHAHNPVDWYPWCQESFDKAKTENKLIFLSIGYSTCHWCHVMEKESFENEDVAKIMNEHYINIKVDREERPDIDHTYMLFVQATTGRGGWPMSIFLTPDLKPVTGGTYFPPEDNWGRPGFKTILSNLAAKWKQNETDFIEAGDKVMAALQKISHLDNVTNIPIPEEKTWKSCVNTFKHIYDPEYGGFGDAPKFPQASIFNFLFHFYSRDKTNELGKTCLDMALYTLKMIAKGGIHDHVSSGFARYSVDQYWHVPHFEKMLYDQAQLTSAFTDAYLATKDDFYADVVHDIIKYVNRDLRHESGGFYSAEDADSFPTFGSKHKKEGAFCVWEFDELKTLLNGKELNSVSYLDVFSDYFNVKVNGNISPDSDPHKELTKKNVLIIYGTKEKTAEKFDLTLEQFNKIIKESIDILYLARQTRPRPHLDSKMICSWNGLMIAGLAQAGQALGNKDYVDDAIKAATFVKKHLFDESTETLLHSCYRGENGSIVNLEKPINAFLDDYAFLIRGLLDLYEASLDLQWLGWANRLQQKQNTLFWDEEHGGYFLSSADDTTVVLRLKEDSDGAEPSGNSVSCHNLLRLSAYGDKTSSPVGGDNERALAEKTLKAFAKRLVERPASLPEMISALMFYIDSPTQVLITGGYSDPRTLELIRVVRARLLPGRVLAVSDPNAAHTNEIPVLNRIRPCGDTPAAYVCRRYACSLPVTDVRQLETLLDEPTHKP